MPDSTPGPKKGGLLSAVQSQENIARLPKTRAENARHLFQVFSEERFAAGEEPAGMAKAFAEHIQVSPSMWSQLKSSRAIGNKMARQIESLCKVEEGWLDVRRDAAVNSISQGEEQAIAAFLKAFRATNSVGRKNLKLLLRDIAEGLVSPQKIKAG